MGLSWILGLLFLDTPSKRQVQKGGSSTSKKIQTQWTALNHGGPCRKKIIHSGLVILVGNGKEEKSDVGIGIWDQGDGGKVLFWKFHD